MQRYNDFDAYEVWTPFKFRQKKGISNLNVIAFLSKNDKKTHFWWSFLLFIIKFVHLKQFSNLFFHWGTIIQSYQSNRNPHEQLRAHSEHKNTQHSCCTHLHCPSSAKILIKKNYLANATKEKKNPQTALKIWMLAELTTCTKIKTEI